MLNTMMENEKNSFTNILISLLRSCSMNDEILAKLLFSFSIIAFNTIKLPVIFNMIKLIGQINIFKLSLSFCPKFSLITIIQPWIITII